MTEAIIVAMITGGITVIVNLISASSNAKLWQYKLEELRADFADLKQRVDKHNNLVERMTIVEQSEKALHHRLDEMKGGH